MLVIGLGLASVVLALVHGLIIGLKHHDRELTAAFAIAFKSRIDIVD